MGNAQLSTANYSVVIADLRAKRDELDRTIALLEAMAGIAAPVKAEEVAPPVRPAPPAPPKTSAPVPERSKETSSTPSVGIGEVCAKILREAREPLSTRDVTDRVLASGFEINTANPINNVWSALSHRMKVTKDITKSGRNWSIVVHHADRSLGDLKREMANQIPPNGTYHGHSHQSNEG